MHRLEVSLVIQQFGIGVQKKIALLTIMVKST